MEKGEPLARFEVKERGTILILVSSKDETNSFTFKKDNKRKLPA